MVRAAALAAVALLALAACESNSASARRGSRVTLRVGLVFTTAGRGGDFAQAALGAAGLAVERAAKEGVTIQIADADYGGEAGRAARIVERLRERTDAIVVATDDPDIAPALDSVQDKPVVHALISKDGLTESGDMVFRVAPTDRLQARKIAEYLTQARKYKRIAVVTDTTRFGQDGRTALEVELAELERPPVMSVSFTPGGDIHTPVAEAGGRNADALVVWAESPGEAARIVVEAHRTKWSYQIVLSGNLATATFAKNASAQVTPVAFRDGMLSVGTWAGPWFRLQRIIQFYGDFRTQNSALAPPQAASVYDAILALARAARDRGTSADALTSGLESLSDFEGAGVPITFAPDKHEGIDLDDIGILGFTKEQDSAGGDFMPEVDTGGGFFTIVASSLDLPPKYRFLQAKV